MKSPICEMLGIDFPLLAFSHCRDVVAAVSNAGGFGVLGASMFPPDRLEQELKWIDEHINGRPYGADLLIPEKFEGKSEDMDPSELRKRIPAGHWEFVRNLLAERGLDFDPETALDPYITIALRDEGVEEILDVAFAHPIKLIVPALGVPPQFLIERAKREGVPVAALVGSGKHAVNQVKAGVDILIASGYEAGGHTGEVGTMVLVPEVIAAIKPVRDVPVLAAGGIITGAQIAASLALGAAGVWTGSVWLTTEEAETIPVVKEKMIHATSRDTSRSRSRTGKPARQLRTSWHDAWEGPGAPPTLPMPLQSILVEGAFAQIDNAAEGGHEGAMELATYFVGQGVGLMTSIRPSSEVVYEMMEDFAAAVERLDTMVNE